MLDDYDPPDQTEEERRCARTFVELVGFVDGHPFGAYEEICRRLHIEAKEAAGSSLSAHPELNGLALDPKEIKNV